MSKKAYQKAYPKEFREKVVQLVRVSERSVREVAEEFKISPDSVRRWVQQAERDQASRQDGVSSPEREELQRLRRENRQLKIEWEILSRAARSCAIVRAGHRPLWRVRITPSSTS